MCGPCPLPVFWCFVLDAVYTAQVFASNETLLLRFGLPFTWWWRAGVPETANVWNRVPAWILLKLQPSFRLLKLAGGVPALSVVHINVDIFWRRRGKTFPFLGGLLQCKHGLSQDVSGWGVGAFPPANESMQVSWERVKHSNWMPSRPEKTEDTDIAVNNSWYSPNEA